MNSENHQTSDDVIPVAVKKSSNSENETRVFLISLEDAVSSPSIHKKINEAELFYNKAQERWLKIMSNIRKNKSNSLLRWKLGSDIEKTKSYIREKWGFEITNINEAVAESLNISKSSVRYITRASRRLRIEDLERMGINWSKVQEVIDIKDDKKMMRCLELISQGVITKDSEIRDFKKLCNSGKLNK